MAGWRVAGGKQHGGKVLADHERDRRVTGESRRLDAAGDHQGQHSPGTVRIGQAEEACCRARAGLDFGEGSEQLADVPAAGICELADPVRDGAGGGCGGDILDLADPQPGPCGVADERVDLAGQSQPRRCGVARLNVALERDSRVLQDLEDVAFEFPVLPVAARLSLRCLTTRQASLPLRTAQLLPLKGFRRWASARPVSRPDRQPATGLPGDYPDRTHTGRRRRASDQVMTAGQSPP